EVKVRGRDVSLTKSGICFKEEEPLNTWDSRYLKHLPPKDALHCRVECDGGSIGVASRGDHAMMYLGGIRVGPKGNFCGDDSEEILYVNKDDQVFRLNRVNERECTGMEP